MAYIIHLIVLAGIFALLAASLNLVSGYLRLLSVGHAAFFGIGAYASALLAVRFGFPWLAALSAAVAFGGMAGALTALSARRLVGDYFLMATLGLGEIVHSVLLNWGTFTGGAIGIMNVPPPSIGGWAATREWQAILLYAPLLGLAFLVLFWIERSPFGRVLRAVGDDELAAKVAGKPTDRLKIRAMAVSGAAAGLAGSLFAHYAAYIDPSSFVTDVSVMVLCMVVLGGLGNVIGTGLGAACVMLLPEGLRFLGLPASVTGQLQQVLFGLALIVLMMVRREGLLPGRILTVDEKETCSYRSSI